MKKIVMIMTTLVLHGGISVFAQTERSSSSMFLQPNQKADVTIPFDAKAEGKRFSPIWGMDLAWINEQNLGKGINHMGKENIGIGRVAYRTDVEPTNDSLLTSSQVQYLSQRVSLFNKVSNTLPLTFTADQEPGSVSYFVVNKSANVEHWAANINAHVRWVQLNSKHPVVGVSPFNEPDYWTVEEGATVQKQVQVAQLLRNNYPRMADVAIVGGNTLNNDMALEWYESGSQWYDWGNTHQLAGSFDTFAGFYQRLAADGKVGYEDEMHNVGEAMIGLEYGATVGIWWGFDSRARGEFCDISRHGVRLAYAEYRPNWTAASVYRHDDGRLKAFIGSSERQAATTTYQFLSPDAEVYFDGYGPTRSFVSVMPGGTGYQKGQTNAERVIDITSGTDVAPYPIDGVYKIVNKATTNPISLNNGGITQLKYTGDDTQKWTIKPATNRTGGDLSYHDIEALTNSKTHINVKNFVLTNNAELLAYSENAIPSTNEQWHLQYAGDGYYFIRNRESALYIGSVGTVNTNNVRVKQYALTDANRDKLLWRIIPADVAFDQKAPVAPSGLTATANVASVELRWNANTEEDLAGYMILRCTEGKNDWNTIARNVTTTTYVDNTCKPATSYYYKVKAIDLSCNYSEMSDSAYATPTGANGEVARLQFDDNLLDITPNAMDAVAASFTPSFVDNYMSGSKAIFLRDSKSQYLQLPYEIASSDDLTVTFWVNHRSSSAWQRVFDFGRDTDHYLFFTPSNGSIARFAIKNGGNEQTVDLQSKLPQLKWVHVAVTIGRDRTVIYLDGKEAASSTGITISPKDVKPVLNYIGRSQFNADPYFLGYLDDMRVFNYALSAEEVQTIMADTTNGIGHIENADEKSVPASVYGLDGKRRQTMGEGINIVNGRKILNTTTTR